MHSLKGAFFKSKGTTDEPQVFYKLKIVFSQKRAKILYFDTEARQQFWLNKFIEMSGQVDINDIYIFGKVAGEGQFGKVYHAIHKKTG
jgi:hypothetical protein